MSIRVLIADDHAVVRSGLRALLSADPDVEVVGEAENGIETLRLTEALRPDSVLLDLTMPPTNGIDTTRLLKAAHPEIVPTSSETGLGIEQLRAEIAALA